MPIATACLHQCQELPDPRSQVRHPVTQTAYARQTVSQRNCVDLELVYEYQSIPAFRWEGSVRQDLTAADQQALVQRTCIITVSAPGDSGGKSA